MPFAPYQVDHQVQNAAKTLGFSKKKVHFKFGFASEQAIAEGKAGAACRGSEHEVVFIWSLKSGKRQLLVDGKDVHFSESGQNGWTADRVWQHSFMLNDTPSGERYNVHFISQPPRPDLPDLHPFDLRVNGLSYFKFNEIWKLGSNQMSVRGVSAGGRHVRQNHAEQALSAEEERQIAQAKLESLRDMADQRQQQQQPAPDSAWANGEQAPELISFDAPPPSQVIVPTSAPPQQQSFSPPVAPSPIGGGFGAAAPAPPPYSGQPAYYAPAPAAPATTQMTPYTGAPAPYGGGVTPQPSSISQAANYGAPPAYVAQTPSAYSASENPFSSPTTQTDYTYGSAPSFARPPENVAAAPVYPMAQSDSGYLQQTAFAQQPSPQAYPPQAYPPQAYPPQQTQSYGAPYSQQ